MSSVREDSIGVGPASFGGASTLRSFRLGQNRPRATSNTPSFFDMPPRNNASSDTAASSSSRLPALATSSSLFLPSINSQGQRTVIDLTGDSPRPPRGQLNPSEIIDVDALPDGLEQPPQFLFERRRHHAPSRALPPRPMEPNSLYNSFQPRFHQELDDPILGHAARVAPIERSMGPGNHSPLNPANFLSQFGLGTFFRQMAQPLEAGLGSFGYSLQSVNYHFQPPINMDYRMGPNGVDHSLQEDAARVREQSYKKPAPAREGFTRSPVEGDALVCPNCEHELGEGEGGSKSTVWIGKCGHAYCGECANVFRAVPQRYRKPRSGQHSGICEVEGCKTSLRGPRGLWEVFL